MTSTRLVRRALLLTLVVTAALVASSCEGGVGVGVGVGYPTRYGSGTGGPPIFVGGPSF